MVSNFLWSSYLLHKNTPKLLLHNLQSMRLNIHTDTYDIETITGVISLFGTILDDERYSMLVFDRMGRIFSTNGGTRGDEY